MGWTITEKILMAHSGRKGIEPGEFILANVDLCLGNDVTAPLAIEEFEKLGIKKVFNRNRIALIPDHFAPNRDIKSANQCKMMREFARAHKIKHYYEVGKMGVEHALLPELGLIRPGELIIGADSHTCTYGALGAFSTGMGSTDLAGVFAIGKCWLKVPQTMKFIYKGRLKKWVYGKDLILQTIGDIGVDGALYKAMEFSGEVIQRMPVDERFSMCNMAIEAGGKSGIIEPDEIAFDYLRAIPSPHPSPLPKGEREQALTRLKSDADANYIDIKEYDVSLLEPQVAAPHLPSNAKAVGEFSNVRIDQAFIGSCTNGRISDLRIAARILNRKKVHKDVRLIVIPATQRIYLEAMKEGLIEIFIKAGGVVSTPTCGPCLGGHMGILAEGETAIATTNRNFTGRMGDLKSKVYLSNPAVAAASAVKGRIAHPNSI